MGKWRLFEALAAGCNHQTEIFGTIAGAKLRVRGILQAVEREDGSGSSFNVRMLTGAKLDRVVTVYVRTLD